MGLRRATPIMACALAALTLALGATGFAFAKTKVSFMCWTTDKSDTDAFKLLVKSFTTDHPDIDVKLIAQPWVGELDYFTRYLAMATAGVAPDVINIPSNYLPNFADSNLVDDLGPWVAKTKFKLSDYTDAGIESASWKGKLYGLNAGTGGDFWVFYNKRVFDESGVVDPGVLAGKGEWNWDNLEAAAVKTSRFDGSKMQRIGYHQMGDASAIMPWIYGMGGQLMNTDGTKSMLDQPAAIAGVQHMWDGVYKRKYFSLAWYPPYNLDHIGAAKKQQFAMVGWWNTFGTFLLSQKLPWALDMVPFPAGPVEAKDDLCTIHSVCLSKQSKQKAAAWELMQFLGSYKGQLIYAEQLQGMPTRKDLVKRFGEIYKASGMAGGQTFLADAMARLHPMDRSSKYDKALPAILDGLTKIWGGKADVAQTMQLMARNANVQLARAKK